MNILSVTNALKEIKLKELDDEFQIAIMNALNNVLTDNVKVGFDSSGDDMRRTIDHELNAVERTQIMQVRIFEDDRDIVRFFNNVEKVQQSHSQALQFDDAIKGNFFTITAVTITFVVLFMLGLYVATEESRGKVPDSRVLSVLNNIVSSLASEKTE